MHSHLFDVSCGPSECKRFHRNRRIRSGRQVSCKLWILFGCSGVRSCGVESVLGELLAAEGVQSS